MTGKHQVIETENSKRPENSVLYSVAPAEAEISLNKVFPL